MVWAARGVDGKSQAIDFRLLIPVLANNGLLEEWYKSADEAALREWAQGEGFTVEQIRPMQLCYAILHQ